MDICAHLAPYIRGLNHFRQWARRSLQVLDEVSVPTRTSTAFAMGSGAYGWLYAVVVVAALYSTR
jgi:hypothetical protein